ncbi:MAG: 2-oxoacid:acceptor oxidoreductase subunit alpha [Candidatus Tectomicrobia bacterium]|nr:2-oxoacid:acceptor oxidoreductase subunit alpha [Candidatus Tectomicrobia bacterium]
MSETVEKPIEELESVIIRFAGDSGDGMQLTGTQFTNTTALLGNDISTFPDFPAEIRAPAGTLPGVSGFQLNFGSRRILTPGDSPDVLVAMNPAALKVNLRDLARGGTLIANEDAFTAQNLKKAGYASNPLEDGSLNGYQLIKVPVTFLTMQGLKELGLPKSTAERCKNFFALGLLCWLYDRPIEPTLRWIEERFGKLPEIAEANSTAIKAGYYFAETTELFPKHYQVKKAPIEPGKYRKITGNEAAALGFVAASRLAKTPLFYGSYPITPASDILHELARFKNYGVKTFQAEDEIAAVTAVIGAAYGGALAVTGTSGPGVALKSEAIGLAVMVELPIVIANVQRAGPSTGMPTKTEQADLFQAVLGRNSESPVAVVAPATPADCFAMAIEACRIATKYMLPVFFLSDGFLANGAEPWKIPALSELPSFAIRHASANGGETFQPYSRDEETLARPWALPGTPGLEHRIGGIEKANLSGNVSYDPDNHAAMVKLRAEKVERIANDIPLLQVKGQPEGDLLVLGWGSTYGPITAAVEQAQHEGLKVSSAHLRYLSPFPRNLGEVLGRFDRVLLPEMNMGQCRMLIRARYLKDVVGLNKVKGRPFMISEILAKIHELLEKGERA